eukprot:TRINITY_DN10684_c0_g1_i1.p1 TRINITY_DN10684_c0_g1~~TRINITY_DN10684_c0_g1_i1.p1  ORF type:complete len:384 (-),score=116.97 TRINITY_DN10684_c0_g1_i1:127-1278(-)
MAFVRSALKWLRVATESSGGVSGDESGRDVCADECRDVLARVGACLLAGDEVEQEAAAKLPQFSRIAHGTLVCELLLWMHKVGQSGKLMKGVWHPLSEFAFFLRFFVPDEWSLLQSGDVYSFDPAASTFFAIPDVNADELTDSAIVYDMFVQHALEEPPQGEEAVEMRAWRMLLCSRLTNMTACGHFADTLTWKIFFKTRECARNSAQKFAVNDLPGGDDKVDAISAHVQAHEHGASFLVRVETDGHVFLVVLPQLPEGRTRETVYVVESILHGCDCWVEEQEFASLADALGVRRGYIRVACLYEYNESDVVRRLGGFLEQCFAHERLSVAMRVAGESEDVPRVTWSDVLQGVVRVNLVEENTKWNDPGSIIVPCAAPTGGAS